MGRDHLPAVDAVLLGSRRRWVVSVMSLAGQRKLHCHSRRVVTVTAAHAKRHPMLQEEPKGQEAEGTVRCAWRLQRTWQASAPHDRQPLVRSNLDRPINIAVHEYLDRISAICIPFSASKPVLHPCSLYNFSRAELNEQLGIGRSDGSSYYSFRYHCCAGRPNLMRQSLTAAPGQICTGLAVNSAYCVDAARTHGGGLWSSTAMTSACLGGRPSTRSTRQPKLSWTERTSMRCGI